MRGEDQRTRAAGASRASESFRIGRRCDGCGHGEENSGWRRGGDSQRGPKGGPGMREMLGVTAAIVGEGPGRIGGTIDRWALQRRDARVDGGSRFSGGGAGWTDCGGAGWRHRFTSTSPNALLEVEVSDEVLRQRMAQWKAPQPRYPTGVFAKYGALVWSASQGAITTPR